MILEPNRQRRRRIFRIAAGLVAVAMVAAVLSSGWLPSALSVANATATPAPPAPSAPGTSPVAVVPTSTPTPSEPLPQPSSTLDPKGCLPPPSELQPATVVDHGPRTRRVVALTFDDGTNDNNVRRILAFLVKNKVNATFFPTGREVELAPETWQMVAKAGYPLGNHTYRHASLAGLCYEAQLKELQRGVRAFQEQPLPLQPIMRPPYEAFDEVTRLAASAAGAPYVILWDVDTRDWSGIGRHAIASAALAGKAGSIVLMHTASASTTAALPTIVKWYRKRGFSFVTVQQLLGIPGPVPFA